MENTLLIICFSKTCQTGALSYFGFEGKAGEEMWKQGLFVEVTVKTEKDKAIQKKTTKVLTFYSNCA
jgi:hypothetical protein